jgi:hypothetical protein
VPAGTDPLKVGSPKVVCKHDGDAEPWAMTTEKQRRSARRNIKKAAAAARRKRTISRLPKEVRTALGRQANKVKRQRQAR